MILFLFVFGLCGIYLNLVDDLKAFAARPKEQRMAVFIKLIKWAIVLVLLYWFGSTFHRNDVTGIWYYNSNGERVF
jgi:hypothetical protein